MCFKKIYSFLFISLFAYTGALALEVDETLTLRILNVSTTKKTILINRGIEDGLTEGDHANFYLPEGIIARGVLVKLAPTRSIWSIYRTVNADYLKEEEVMNLKITKPVRLSSDPTRQVWKKGDAVQVEGGSGRSRITLAPGAMDIGKQKVEFSPGDEGDSEFRELLGDREMLNSYSYELFGALYFSYISNKASGGANSGEISGGQQSTVIQFGGEFYFIKPDSWYSNFSLAPFVQLSGQKVFGQRGTQTGNNFIDLGFMIHYYPLKNKPWHSGKFIPYLHLSYALRSVSDSFTPGAEVTATLGGSLGQPKSFSGDGSGSVLTIGAGVRLYTGGGRWGVRFLIGYESSAITFGKDSTGTTWTRTGGGVKVVSGLGYRF